MSEEIVIRKADRRDLRFLYELRNDPAVVAASVTGRGVDLRVHALWFEQKLREGALLFVAEVGGVPAGYVRFDPISSDRGSFEVAVGLVEERRGKGLGRTVIKYGSRLAEALGARKLVALIRPENSASAGAFTAAGYIADHEYRRVESDAGAGLDRYTRESSGVGDRHADVDLAGRCAGATAPETTPVRTRPYSFLLVADWGGGAGLGHFRRMHALGEALEALGSRYAIMTTPPAEDHRSHDRAEEIGSVSPLGETLLGRPVLSYAELSWSRRAFDAAVLDSYRITPGDAAALDPMAALADGSPPPVQVPILVDPAPGASANAYRSLAQTVLAGAEYALLTSSFWELTPKPPAFPPRRILVGLGAAAQESFVDSVVAAVHDAVADSEVWSPAPETGPEEYFSQLCAADLVVVAGGVSSLEAARAGIPAVGMVLSPNQRQNIEGLERQGALVPSAPDAGAIARIVKRISEDRGLFESLSAAGPQIVDGKGACRVATALVERIHSEQPSPEDTTR